MGKITIKMIAQAAQTSPTTVSRYLSRQGYVSDVTRDRIEEAIEALGYAPKKQNFISTDSTKKIVMVVSADVSGQVYIDYFQGMSDYLSDKGYVCLQAYSDRDAQKECKYLKYAEENQFGAVIMLNATETPELVAQLQKMTRPVVFVNRHLRSADVDAITVDNYRGGYVATRYLLDAGHRNIVHLSGMNYSVITQDRMMGFRDAMLDAGVSLTDEHIFRGDMTEKSGEKLAAEIARHPGRFTAAFVANDYMAIGLLNGLHKRGIRVPEDFSIINFDSTPLAKNARVRLTSVGFDSVEMGRAAGEVVYQKMHAQTDLPRKVIYPAAINEGDSVTKCR